MLVWQKRRGGLSCWILAGILLSLLDSPSIAAPPAGWQAGAARAKITPDKPLWMSGYASRDRPAEGTLHDLWAKALVLDDSRGERVALVTLDLVGIDRQFSQEVCRRIEAEHGLARRQVALASSHTHTGPVIGENLRPMYVLSPQQEADIVAYTRSVQDKIVAAVGEALANLAPAKISWSVGQTTFGVNRRNNPEPQVPQLRADGKLVGPVDHDVPVLRVTTDDSQLLAVVFGYACHATTLSFFQWSGDYPGFAQLALEAAHPGATAMFFAGCGADQNPLPRRTVELAQHYGEQLAAAVEAELAKPMQAITGSGDHAGLASAYTEVPVPFAELPTREQLASDSNSKDHYIASRAKHLLAKIDAGQPLSPTYPYPAQTWRIGPDLAWVWLGGEVVVDYSLRLKSELGPRTFVGAYANDVMAYIPSRRVLGEGGYEGGGAMVYYGLPTIWAPAIEEKIVDEVQAQVEQLRAGTATRAP